MGHLVEVGGEKTLWSKATTRRLALRPESSLLACFIYYCRSNHEYHNSFSTVKFIERALPLTGTARLLQPSGLSFFVLFCSLRYFCRLYLISPVFMHCLGWFLIDQKIRWMHLLGQSTISPWSASQIEIVDCISKQQSTISQNSSLPWSFCPWI